VIAVVVLVAGAAAIYIYSGALTKPSSTNASPSATTTSCIRASSTATNSSGYVVVHILQGSGIAPANASAYEKSSAVYGYGPANVTLVLGVNSTVVWINDDCGSQGDHTIFRFFASVNSDTFDSGRIKPGGSFSYTFTKAGTYGYACEYHHWMTGYVIVKEA